MVHNGKKDGRELYKCKDCGRQFVGGEHRDKRQVISDYVDGKQTIAQLSAKYGVSQRTIVRDMEAMHHVRKISKDKHVVIQMDTTYWGRGFGLMAIKDAFRNKILWHKYVRYETVADYMEGVAWIKNQGFVIYGAVIDGIRGLAQALWPYPVQLCQFHQMLIVRRYLTLNPELEAGQSLWNIVKNITKTDKEKID